MNKQRRKAIDTIATKLGELRADLETVHDEEEEAFENMPESLQDGDSGQANEMARDAINEAVQAIEEATAQLEEATMQ